MFRRPAPAALAAPARALAALLTVLFACGAGAGCSIKKMAVRSMGDALAGSGTTFSSDDDPELIRAAAPFSLKLMESVLAEVPDHQNLLFAASSGFTQYAYAFVQQDADELEQRDLAAAKLLRARAAKLYRRARDYGLRALAVTHPGFEAALRAKPKEAVLPAVKEDVRLLYWTAISWGALIALSKDQPSTVAEIPQMEAMLDRAFELDESFDSGAIHAFFITYEMSRQGKTGDPALRSRKHFERAVELSGGRLAGPFVSLAEAVCVQKQDVKEFDSLLARALAIDPDANPANRLVNLVMQRRARWLQTRREDLFLLDPGT
ncbi:MAG: hypothetical protein HZA54_14155 [Planctomycetes bacterium]|nr:hypothetical protein [Planctomycetota bacterium]